MFGSSGRKNKEILHNYKRIKKSAFDFERIALFFKNKDHNDALQVISDGTLQNLDFDELFMFMDRTCSRIGQQYLYLTLRTIPSNNNRSILFEKIISYFNENPGVNDSSVLELSKLNKPGAYFLQQLIFGDDINQPRWFWAIPILSVLSVVLLILSFLFPQFIILFLLVLPVNAFIHFWNKKNIMTYSNSIPQLLILNQVASRLIRSGVFMDDTDQLQMSNNKISAISKEAVFFKWEIRLLDELGQFVDYILELVKILFLLEPIFFFILMRKVRIIKPEICKVYTAVAQVDVAISISSFRESLAYYSFPSITGKIKSLAVEEIYHPLILKPVSNSIDLSNGKSVLISGSNMSGKTTFIRTIGINIILAQTINTCCARNLTMPRLRIHSVIRITDDLFDETSYYYEEVKAIKHMIDQCESDDQNVFLLDEIFRGTNTVERISSGKSVLSYLAREENLVFASTHDLELTEFLSDYYDYYHFAEIAKSELLTFDYKLKKGKVTKTNAIRILEINNYPKEITDEAKALANKMQDRYFKD